MRKTFLLIITTALLTGCATVLPEKQPEDPQDTVTILQWDF